MAFFAYFADGLHVDQTLPDLARNTYGLSAFGCQVVDGGCSDYLARDLYRAFCTGNSFSALDGLDKYRLTVGRSVSSEHSNKHLSNTFHSGRNQD